MGPSTEIPIINRRPLPPVQSTSADNLKCRHKLQENFKERVSKLGTGVSERFAALGSMMQDHGSKAGGGIVSSKASPENPPATENSSASHHSDSSTTVFPPTSPHAASDNVSVTAPKRALEYFQEYELTFNSEPDFFVVPAPSGKGAVVAWTATSTVVSGGASTPSESAQKVPPAGAVILAVAGESVVDAQSAYVAGLLSDSSRNASTNEGNPSDLENGDGSETPPLAENTTGGPFPLVVRFREKIESKLDGAGGGLTGAPGGEFFRNRVKAMATGLGNLFQAKETGGSAVRDGSDVGASGSAAGGAGAPAFATLASDVFVLTFAAEDGTAEALPFTMAEMIGGQGVVVSAVREGYASLLLKPAEPGVSGAATAAIVGGGVADEESEGTLGVLSAGAVLLRVAGQNVEGASLAVVEKKLEAAASEHLAVSAAQCFMGIEGRGWVCFVVVAG